MHIRSSDNYLRPRSSLSGLESLLQKEQKGEYFVWKPEYLPIIAGVLTLVVVATYYGRKKKR